MPHSILPKLRRAIRATGAALAPLMITTSGLAAAPQEPRPAEVPVTIKELDVAGAIAEFQSFKSRLGDYREEIGKGRAIARETAQILDELRATATPENGFNEKPILAAVTGYVDGVLGAQVELVDFLESQRYRISYYAGKMAASVRPEDLAILFGSPEQNDVALKGSVQAVDAASQDIKAFVDTLPADQFDKRTFRPTQKMPRETRAQLNQKLARYQAQKNGLDLAKRRLQLVRAAQRGGKLAESAELEIDSDLLVGQMFGALDKIRLQMSMDLIALEQLLSGYARSARTQGILDAFQSLVEMQGDLEGPSPELSSVLDWLQDSSVRRLSLSANGLKRPGLDVPRYSDMLREAYVGAKAPGSGLTTPKAPGAGAADSNGAKQ